MNTIGIRLMALWAAIAESVVSARMTSTPYRARSRAAADRAVISPRVSRYVLETIPGYPRARIAELEALGVLQ